MNSPDFHRSPSAEFARRIVQRLRGAGFEAWLAGGCVRDWLMGVEPKDYDVATSAPPDQVRKIFGRRSTVAVGESFGVIVVNGPAPARPVEVATFRRDAAYSDGRHPDSVEFTTGEEDASRRDFTINAIFYDPLEDRVIDFVGGLSDLRNRLVRAVGDPVQRFREDHLRMLRAVRFAATLQFALDPDTLSAIIADAELVQTVSAERVAAEMRKILASPHRAIGLQLLRQSRLLGETFPELEPFAADESDWSNLLAVAERLQSPNFATALGCLFYHLAASARAIAVDQLATTLSKRWKLTRRETKQSQWLPQHVAVLTGALSQPWPRVQRCLVHEDGRELLALATALVTDPEADPHLAFCREKLALPIERLNPPLLFTGKDLLRWGIERGPCYATILDAVRDAQLVGDVHTVDEAQALARRLLSDQTEKSDESGGSHGPP